MSATSDLKYWICLSKIPGIGTIKTSNLLKYFGSIEDAWKATHGDLTKAGLDSRTISNFIAVRKNISPEDEIEKIHKFNVKAIPFNSRDYPARLKEIHDYPPLLYVRGNLLPSDDYSLAIVGTRRPTIYGRQVTEEIVTDLAHNSITVVSGLAKGIDAVAHQAAIHAGGRTLAVFACGLDIVYPAENAQLARHIIDNGAIISEYPIGTRPRSDNFPRRNRILSGLSLGVLVVEAGEKSGALITVEQALMQNREVFAIPGSILSPLSKGTNLLLQQGAKLVRNYMDILEELNLAQIAQQLEMKEVLSNDPNETLLIKFLGKQPRHIDEICRNSGLTASLVSSTLSLMELKGMVKQIGSMNYIIAHEMK